MGVVRSWRWWSSNEYTGISARRLDRDQNNERRQGAKNNRHTLASDLSIARREDQSRSLRASLSHIRSGALEYVVLESRPCKMSPKITLARVGLIRKKTCHREDDNPW